MGRIEEIKKELLDSHPSSSYYRDVSFLLGRLEGAEQRGMLGAAKIADANKANYPKSVFIPPTKAQSKQAHILLQAVGLSLDRFSAFAVRMSSDNIAAAIRAEAAKLKESRLPEKYK